MDLTQATVAITGAASGIGRATARRLSAQGCALALADIEAETLDQTVAELAARGPVIGVTADVSDPDEVAEFAATAVAEFGAVDVLVNNAGVATFNLIEDQSLDDWRWVIDVNLLGVVHGVHAFLPHLVTRPRAHVVNVASVAGIQSGIAFLGPYAASKVAVVSITETLAVELAATHPQVGVTVVCPGNTDTAVMEAERNRPAARGTESRTADADAWRRGIHESFTGPTGRSADQVAAQLIDGVEAGRLFVFTHPDMTPLLTERLHRVTDAVTTEHERLIAEP